MEKIDFSDNPTTTIPIKQVQAAGTIVYVSDSNAVYYLLKTVNYTVESSKGEILFTGEKFRWVRLSGLLDTSDPVTTTYYENHKAAIGAFKDAGEFFQFSDLREFFQKALKRGWN